MHLSFLSDAFVSDSLDDAGPRFSSPRTAGQVHRDGVVRGIIFLVVLALPFGVAFGASALEQAHAGHQQAALLDR